MPCTSFICINSPTSLCTDLFHLRYLLISIVASRPTLLEELYESKTVPFKTFLLQSILGIKSKEIRERFSMGWQQLCAEVKSESDAIPSPSAKILGILLEDVPFGRDPSFDADYYFDLLVNLFSTHFDQVRVLSIIPFTQPD